MAPCTLRDKWCIKQSHAANSRSIQSNAYATQGLCWLLSILDHLSRLLDYIAICFPALCPDFINSDPVFFEKGSFIIGIPSPLNGLLCCTCLHLPDLARFLAFWRTTSFEVALLLILTWEAALLLSSIVPQRCNYSKFKTGAISFKSVAPHYKVLAW